MRDIHRLEQLALDAIDRLSDPTFGEVRAYIAQRRRVGFWTAIAIFVALIRLEEQGRVEARRSTGLNGKARWGYRRVIAIVEHVRQRCACDGQASTRQ
jgi:hypothetical protein